MRRSNSSRGAGCGQWTEERVTGEAVSKLSEADAGSRPGVPGRSRADFEAMNRNLLRKPRATLVGPSKTSEVMVEALSRLTLRDDIASTTVHGWASALPTKDSFRAELAYCPCCYAEWARPPRAGDPPDPTRPRRPYEPLIW